MFGIANNNEFLTAIGIIDAPKEQREKLVASLEDLAEKKLIINISERLTEDQAEELSKITDEKQAYEWIVVHFPDFPALVSSTLENLKKEILNYKKKILDEDE